MCITWRVMKIKYASIDYATSNHLSLCLTSPCFLILSMPQNLSLGRHTRDLAASLHAWLAWKLTWFWSTCLCNVDQTGLAQYHSHLPITTSFYLPWLCCVDSMSIMHLSGGAQPQSWASLFSQDSRTSRPPFPRAVLSTLSIVQDCLLHVSLDTWHIVLNRPVSALQGSPHICCSSAFPVSNQWSIKPSTRSSFTCCFHTTRSLILDLTLFAFTSVFAIAF